MAYALKCGGNYYRLSRTQKTWQLNAMQSSALESGLEKNCYKEPTGTVGEIGMGTMD